MKPLKTMFIAGIAALLLALSACGSAEPQSAISGASPSANATNIVAANSDLVEEKSLINKLYDSTGGAASMSEQEAAELNRRIEEEIAK